MYSAPVRIQNRSWRVEDTGFLRVTAAIASATVMDYQPGELPGAPTDRAVRILMPLDSMGAPDVLPTLEGKPVLIGHVWQDVTTSALAVGAIAGAPTVSGPYLMADVLITNAEAARRVMLPDGDPDRLEEISAGYTAEVDWTPGVTADGQPYDGVFRAVKYNHIALLPAGMGRAGRDVRIINRRGQMPDFVSVRVRGRLVRVLNEDAAMLEKEIENMEGEAEKVKNQMTPEQITAALEELTALKQEVGDKNARISELEGQIKAYQDQLSAALSGDAVAEAVEEQAEAAGIMNSIGGGAIDKKMVGHALRVHVVNSILQKRGQQPMSEAQAADQSYVRGMFKGYAATAPRIPAGADVVQINNQAPPAPMSPRLGIDAWYGQKKEAGK